MQRLVHRAFGGVATTRRVRTTNAAAAKAATASTATRADQHRAGHLTSLNDSIWADRRPTHRSALGIAPLADQCDARPFGG